MQCPNDADNAEHAPDAPNHAPERRAPVQGEYIMHGGRVIGRSPDGTITWAEHLDAFEHYAAEHGRDQSAERVAARGGFGINELRQLLGHEPRTFEATE